MAAESLKTLFHPFEAGALSVPAEGERVLFLGAEPGFRLPEGWAAEVHAVQGFRPDFRALEGMRLASVSPRAKGEGYAAALVLAGRHRGRNELLVAEALERTAAGGRILVAGSKDDGVASLRKRLESLVGGEGSLPKYHGLAFWFRRTQDGAAATALRAANPPMLVDGRFHTAPGMFSFDRVDAGSRLLMESMPAQFEGRIADFCAGWGYLAAEIVARSGGIAALDVYEADFEALEAARRNVRETSDVSPRFFWHDLLAEPVEEKYDVIVMNPPFHRARAAEPEVGAGMVRAAAKALRPGGRLLMVANRQLPYERVLAAAFSRHDEIAADGMFKVFSARR